MEHNVPVPAMLTIELLEEEAQWHGTAGLLLDGFPGSPEQLAAFTQDVRLPLSLLGSHLTTSRSQLGTLLLSWTAPMKFFITDFRPVRKNQEEMMTDRNLLNEEYKCFVRIKEKLQICYQTNLFGR